MQINKVGINQKNQTFKAYTTKIDSNGRERVYFDEPTYVYPVRPNVALWSGYQVLEDKGQLVNSSADLEQLGIKDGETFAYRRQNPARQALDVGINIGDGFRLASTKTTHPLVQGSMYFTMPDSHLPGAYRDYKTGKIHYNQDKQKAAESECRTFSNKFGGTIAGLEYDIPNLVKHGYKILATTPIAGGDDVSSHHYWNKNNFQVASDLGTLEDYKSFARALYQNGMKYVYDATFTSEGLEGINFQNALRWNGHNPQTYYRFMMMGIKDGALGLGVIPENHENLRYRIINPTVVYNTAKGTVEPNPDYNPNRETYFQIYDDSMISEEQRNNPNEIIRRYEGRAKTELSINTHNDTIIPYKFEITPKEYEHRLEEYVKYCKASEKGVNFNTPEAAIFIGQFSGFKITPKTEGGMITWDANTDMVKRSHQVSPYIEGYLKSIPDEVQRNAERKRFEIGALENTDLDLQTVKYWAKFFKNEQTIYTAKTLQKINSVEDIDKLIEKGLLPKETKIDEETFQNILDGFYELEPIGLLSKDDTTIKAVMELPLATLELGENTVGLLGTSYFSNIATTEDTLGKSRFELYQEGNPHLLKEYAENYQKVNALYSNEIKTFADKIIEKLNNTSSEKLLDKDGNYTEYGEYIINLYGKDIARFAILKALAGEHCKVEIREDGYLNYNYNEIKENTTLKALGINAASPEQASKALRQVIKNGLEENITTDDIQTLTNYIQGQIGGTNALSFRLSEALVKKAGLGLDFRLDAIKDVIDMDAVRNGTLVFDDAWDKLIDYTAKLVSAIKEVNPNANIIAEITDIEQLMKATYGQDAKVYEHVDGKYKNVQDAMVQFFLKTGVTSEAGYSYFFSSLARAFSRDFETGNIPNSGESDFIGRILELSNTRTPDYIRNMMSFVGNHDKPRVLHMLALDLELFYANYQNDYRFRETALEILYNADSFDALPEEIREKAKNPEYFQTVNNKAVAMSKLIKDSINSSLNGVATEEEITLLKKALADLTNGSYLGEGNQVPFTVDNVQRFESLAIKDRKEGYGSRDLETAVKMVIKQAEYLGGKKLENSDAILVNLYETMTMPAVNKFARMMTVLSALPGQPMMYGGDELGMSGADKKAKNIDLQNRNARVVSELEDENDPLHKVRSDIYAQMTEAMTIRTNPDAKALNSGTPIKAETSDPYVSSLVSTDADGDANVSIISIDDKGEDGFKDVNYIIIPAEMFAVGTIFKNILSSDKGEYIVRRLENGLTGIVNNFAPTIRINKETATKGVAMILKKVK